MVPTTPPSAEPTVLPSAEPTPKRTARPTITPTVFTRDRTGNSTGVMATLYGSWDEGGPYKVERLLMFEPYRDNCSVGGPDDSRQSASALGASLWFF